MSSSPVKHISFFCLFGHLKTQNDRCRDMYYIITFYVNSEWINCTLFTTMFIFWVELIKAWRRNTSFNGPTKPLKAPWGYTKTIPPHYAKGLTAKWQRPLAGRLSPGWRTIYLGPHIKCLKLSINLVCIVVWVCVAFLYPIKKNNTSTLQKDQSCARDMLDVVEEPYMFTYFVGFTQVIEMVISAYYILYG
jgi:hypothetical protein